MEMLESLRDALTNMVTNIVDWLPNLVLAIVLIIIGWLFARFIARLAERVAERIGLDKVLERIGVAKTLEQAEIGSGSHIVSLLIFWAIFLNFLLISLESAGLQAAVEPLNNLVALFPRILAALIILIGGALLAQFIGRAAEAGMASMGVEFHQQVGQGVNVLLLVMVIIVVLQQLGLDASIMINIVTSVIILSVAGLALAFGLGGRGVAQNVLAGYYARDQFALGDRIEVNGQEGTLEGVGTVNSELRIDGERLVIPNVMLTETAVIVKRDAA